MTRLGPPTPESTPHTPNTAGETWDPATEWPATPQELYSTLTLVRAWGDIVGRQSKQTGIHRKATARPEHLQLLAPQRQAAAGDQRARHQVEEGRLATLHEGQRHEGHQEADAIGCGTDTVLPVIPLTHPQCWGDRGS